MKNHWEEISSRTLESEDVLNALENGACVSGHGGQGDAYDLRLVVSYGVSTRISDPMRFYSLGARDVFSPVLRLIPFPVATIV